MSYPCPLSPLRPSEAATPAEAEWISSLCRAVVPRLGGDLLVPAVRAVVWEAAREPDRFEARLNALAEVAAAAAAGRCAAEYWWVGRDIMLWRPLVPNRVVARVELPAVTTRYDRRRRRWVLLPAVAAHRYDVYLRAVHTDRPKVKLLPVDVNSATIALNVFPAAPPPGELLEDVRARVIAAAMEAVLEEAGA
jgi:hypothetical protein